LGADFRIAILSGEEEGKLGVGVPFAGGLAEAPDGVEQFELMRARGGDGGELAGASWTFIDESKLRLLANALVGVGKQGAQTR
jgi:hypothetical protein